MADQANSIDIVLRDQVDASIAPKIIMIADSSDRAEKSVGSLKAQLASIGASGFGTLLSQLQSVQGVSAAVAQSQDNLASRTRSTAAATREATQALAQQRAAIAEAIEDRNRLRAENEGVAISEKAVQAQWERSIAIQTQAQSKMEGMALARARDTELQEFSAQVSNLLTEAIERQAVAAEASVQAERQRIDVMTFEAETSSALALASETLASAQVEEAAAYRQVAAATITLAEAKSALRELSASLVTSTVGEEDAVSLLAAAMLTQADAAQQLLLAKNNLAEVSALVVEQTIQESDSLAGNAAAAINATIAIQEKLAADQLAAAAEAERTAASERAQAVWQQELIMQDRRIAKEIELARAQELSALRSDIISRSVETEATAVRAAAGASGGLVSANVSAAASMGLLEGRTLSMNRAAANFTTKILGLGPIMQAAFPVIGAIALIAVLYQMGEALVKVIKNAMDAGKEISKAFDGVISTLRKSDDQLAVTNDKLDQTIAKLEHKPTTNGAALALDEAREAADRLDSALERVQNDLDTILKKNQIGLMGSILTGQATTGGTADYIQKQFDTLSDIRQKATDALDTAAANKDTKAAQAATQQAYAAERIGILNVVNALKTKYNATKELQDQADKQNAEYKASGVSIGDQSAGGALPDNSANLALLGKSAHLAQEELRSLDLTMANIEKNKAVDNLRDSTSSMRAETKAAALQWKELESAYKHFQESEASIGHKTTPKENLDAINSLSKTLTIPSQVNQDKLTALKLPQENKLTGSNFVEDEQKKLQDQIGTIGLYSNALKEASDLNHILEAARKKNVDLTPQEIAGFKAQIKEIVEAREYDKELATVYTEVTGAALKFNATMEAVNTLSTRGQLTAEQHTQAIFQLMKEYSNASDAVAKFGRELADQDRDSSNKLGTQRQISVKGTLQGLDNNLRKSNADTQHPFGYSEDEIKKVNAALSPLITAQQRKIAVDEEANKLINAQSDAEDKLAIQEAALAKAVREGALSQQAANSMRNKAALDMNTQKLQNGTGGDSIIGAIGEYAKDFTTLAAGIQSTMKPVFKTLADGFADSIGKAIVYSKDLGKALRDVARSALAELISGLVKLGIQQALQLTIGTALGTAATAAGVAQATVLATAWAAPAVSASIATLGAADAIGGAAYATTLAASTALAAVPKLSVGTNNVPADMYAMIHQDERVVPAADNRAIINALNNGPQSIKSAPMRVEIHNHNGSRIEAQQMDEGTVRLIVRDEAPGLIAQHAPTVISNDIGDPNSKTSKAIRRNVTPARVR